MMLMLSSYKELEQYMVEDFEEFLGEAGRAGSRGN